jgi:hypothetical protein
MRCKPVNTLTLSDPPPPCPAMPNVVGAKKWNASDDVTICERVMREGSVPPMRTCPASQSSAVSDDEDDP